MRADNVVSKIIYAQVAIVACTLLFLLIAPSKWAGEKTTYQTLPVVGLTLIFVSGVSDIIYNTKLPLIPEKHALLRQTLLTICRILLQN
jgi:hypothetical protein